MKIKYRFANGEVSEVEVDDELGAVITASRREEENYERKMRYHCPYSIDKLVYEGEDYADKEMPSPDTHAENKEEGQGVQAFLETLTEVQRRRVHMRMDGMTITEIAEAEGTSYMSVKETFTQLKKKFSKFFKKHP